MRYLDKYKMFESKTDLEIEIEDILLEVSDIDYQTCVNTLFSGGDLIIMDIYIIKRSNFDFDEIKDCLDRVLEYIHNKEIYTPKLHIKDNNKTIITFDEEELKDGSFDKLYSCDFDDGDYHGFHIYDGNLKHFFEQFNIRSILIKVKVKVK